MIRSVEQRLKVLETKSKQLDFHNMTKDEIVESIFRMIDDASGREVSESELKYDEKKSGDTRVFG